MMTPFSSMRQMLQTFLFIVCFAVPFGAIAALPPEDQAALNGDCSYEAWKEALGVREAGGSYENDTNPFGYLGLYQMGEEALMDAGFYSEANPGGRTNDWGGSFTGFMGVNSKYDFLHNKAAQEYAHDSFLQSNWNIMVNNGTVDRFRAMGYSDSGILAASQFGVGNMRACSLGTRNCADGFGTSYYEYMERFANYSTPMTGDSPNGQCSSTPYTGKSRAQMTYESALCDPAMLNEIKMLSQSHLNHAIERVQATIMPPTSRDDIANGPCMSNKLSEITSQFSNSGSGLGSIFSGLDQNAGGLFAGLSSAGMDSMSNALKIIGPMDDLQNKIQDTFQNLMGSIFGASNPMTSQYCGMMLDKMVEFVQCFMPPIEMPSFEFSLGGGSLNLDLPKNCAGDLARKALDSGVLKLPDLSQGIKLENGMPVLDTGE